MMSEVISEFFARFSIDVDKDSLKQVEQNIGRTKESIEKFGVVAQHMEHQLNHLKTAIKAYLGLESIAKVFEVNSEISNTFNQLVNATGSTEIAKQNLDELIQFADKSKLSIIGLAESFGPFQNQMVASGISSEKSLKLFKDMQVAYAGAHISATDASRSQRDVAEFISGSMTMARLKSSEFGMRLAPVMIKLQEKFGEGNEADKKIKALTAGQRAELVAQISYQTYAKGQEEYEHSPMAALQNVKNKLAEFALTLGNSGFTDLAVNALNLLANAFSGLGKIVGFVGGIIQGIRKSFNEMPWLFYSVAAAVTALTIALNLNRIADIAASIAAGVLAVATNALAIATGVATFWEVLLTAPLWLIVAGVGAVITIIALLADDVYTYFAGGKSVFGIIVGWFKILLGWFKSFGVWVYDHLLGPVLSVYATIAKAIFKVIELLWQMSGAQQVVDVVVEAIKSFLSVIASLFVAIYESVIAPVINAIGDFISVIVDVVEGVWKYLKNKLGEIKNSILNAFSDVKKYLLENIIGPFEKLWDKIKSFANTPLPSEQNKSSNISNAISSGLNQLQPPEQGYFWNPSYLASSSQAPTSVVNQTYQPASINISIPENHGMNEKQLGVHIGKQVETALYNHYSQARSDVTRRE